jgi:hypothetical protein
MNLNNRNIIALIVLLLLLCLISFALGVYSLRNGTLRKAYDIIFALKNIELNNIKDINYTSLPKIDTLDLKMSKKKRNLIIKIRSNKVNSLLDIVTYGIQWIGERPWFNAKLIHNHQDTLHGKIKLIGMNSDHFRESENWSFRVKLNSNEYFNGVRKFNLVVPYSRGYFIDAYYNSIFKQEGGLTINSKPIITKLLNSYQLQIFEPFFSKELIESQRRRDGLILTDDSVDINHVKHLKLVHPDTYTSLSPKQRAIYQFYDREFRNGKLQRYINIKHYAFLTSVGINVGGNTHHMRGFNLYLYADPINGELLPFLREVSSIYGENNIIYNYNTLKKEFYNSLKLNKNNISNFDEFDYWVNHYSLYLNKLNINEIITHNRYLLSQYYYANKYYPWAYAFKNRIKVPMKFTRFIDSILNKPKHLVIITGNKVIKDKSIIFSTNDSIIFRKETNLIVKNSTIVFSGFVGTSSDFTKLKITGDSLSTLIFTNSNVNLHNSYFKGFGNKIKIQNRDVTAAITFSNSTLNLKNCTFEGGYSGDDLVNIFRSYFFCEEIKLSNARSDGFDLDFSKGSIINSSFSKCGNDGIDAGSSNVKIVNTQISECGDKAISIGEQSDVQVNKVNIHNSEIGIGLKDGSLLSLKEVTTINNSIDLAAYGKKGLYGPASIVSVDSSFRNLHYLIEPSVNLPNSLKVKFTIDIINYMYGKHYGKASIK